MPISEKPKNGERRRKYNEPTVTVSGKIPESIEREFLAKALANRISKSEALCEAVRAWVASRG